MPTDTIRPDLAGKLERAASDHQVDIAAMITASRASENDGSPPSSKREFSQDELEEQAQTQDKALRAVALKYAAAILKGSIEVGSIAWSLRDQACQYTYALHRLRFKSSPVSCMWCECKLANHAAAREHEATCERHPAVIELRAHEARHRVSVARDGTLIGPGAHEEFCIGCGKSAILTNQDGPPYLCNACEIKRERQERDDRLAAARTAR